MCVCVCLCGGLPCLSLPSPQSMACPRFIHINFGHTKLGQIQYIKIQSLTLFSMYNQEIIELTNKHDKSRPVGFNGQISLSFCLLMQTSKNLINCISSPTWFYFTLSSKAALILPYFNLAPSPRLQTHTHTQEDITDILIMHFLCWLSLSLRALCRILSSFTLCLPNVLLFWPLTSDQCVQGWTEPGRGGLL